MFLPAVFLLDRTLSSLKARNALLLAASLLFYAFGEPVYVFLMLISILLNYFWGRLAALPGFRGRVGVTLAVIFNIGLLIVFKYADFLLANLNLLLDLALPLPGIRLPVGISFFTFQALSYVIDTYRDPSCCQKHLGKLALYISFFPQLVAGPIVRYGDIAAEIDHRKTSLEDTAEGIRRFIIGLAKKLLIANTVGLGADRIFAVNGGGSILPAWTGAILYCLQIYYDFSGYSDMAIGLGRMFGFHFKENFAYPYAASSIQDFWRRWHISLTGWFRSYLYIPLGGNRKGKVRMLLNQYLVFLMTGLWHGASWNFILWGQIHAAALVLENTVLKPLKNRKIIGRVYMLIVVAAAFVLFRADTLSSALVYLADMFGGFCLTDASLSQFLMLLDPWLIFIAVTGIILALPVKNWAAAKLSVLNKTVSYAAALALFVLCLLNLSATTFNPFIYFRF